jgi:hypothetical protein
MIAGRQLGWRRQQLRPSFRAARREERAVEQAIGRGEPVPISIRGDFVLREYGRLLLDHQPRPPFPEHVLLLRTDGAGENAHRDWGPILGSRLQIVDVPGTHLDLSTEASAAYVGRVLGRAIDGLAPEPPLAEPAATA